MERGKRINIVGGALLVLLGLLFLAYQLMPNQLAWLRLEMSWPLTIVAVGAALLILGLVVGVPAMAIPACIVGGIGFLLYWQNLTGHWESWAYAWSLIPGFVGVGIILAGLLGEGRLRDALESGFWLILISLILFAIFGSFLGGLDLFGPYWPILLIALGLVLLVRGFFRRVERR